MTHSEDQIALLGTDDTAEDFDEEAHAAMQKMMGFSSFGGPLKPKRQPKGPGPGKGFGTGANSSPLQPRTNPITSQSTYASNSMKDPLTVSKPLSATSNPFIPASIPQRLPKTAVATVPPVEKPSLSPITAHFQNLNPITAVASPPLNRSMISSTLDPTINTVTPGSEFSIAPFPPPRSRTATNTTTTTTTTNTTSNTPAPSTIAATPFQARHERLADWTSEPDSDLPGYVNPDTGYTLTKRELAAYERGVLETVVNNDGTVSQVKVYFKPNFIEDNPWEELEVKAGIRKAKQPERVAAGNE